MPKNRRLTGEEMKKLSGKRTHGRFFSLLVAPMPSSGPKLAVVVSKKVSPKAVDRNKVKRQARSASAKALSNVRKPVGLVLYAKRDAKDAPFVDMKRDIESLFSKL